MKTLKLLPLVLIAANALAPYALANETPVSTQIANDDSARSEHRLGAYLGVGEPAPGILGINLGYNILDMLRATAGYGKISVSAFGTEASATTLGAGVRAMVPGWSLTPAVGLHYGHISYSGSGIDVRGFTESGGHIYATAGLDYQAKSGFNGGIGVVKSFKSGIDTSWYLNLGWFFDLPTI